MKIILATISITSIAIFVYPFVIKYVQIFNETASVLKGIM